LSPELDLALERVAHAPILLVACDFDGTLSPIVMDPAAAAPDPEALEALSALAGLPHTPVLVLSGRARDDLARRLGDLSRRLHLIGSHGAEEGGTVQAGRSGAIETLRAALSPVVRRFPGAELEGKPFSVAFHFRRVRGEDQEAARSAAVDAVGLRAVDVRSGKKVVEFMAIRADKGSALQRFRSRLGADATVFVGDDVTDEAAFRSLAPEDVGVKVGPEPTAAAFRLTDQENVAAALTLLLEHRTAHTRG